MVIKIIPTQSTDAVGKLADVELHFDNPTEPLAGLRSCGWAVWSRRIGVGRNVTHPARSYCVNGERRSFALIRPIGDPTASDRIRQQILDAYDQFERAQ